MALRLIPSALATFCWLSPARVRNIATVSPKPDISVPSMMTSSLKMLCSRCVAELHLSWFILCIDRDEYKKENDDAHIVFTRSDNDADQLALACSRASSLLY